MTTANKTGSTENIWGSGQGYRFERFQRVAMLSGMRFSKSAPKAGNQIPDFKLETLDSGTFLYDDIKESGPASLVFGSLTCPMTDSLALGINELYKKYGDRVRFVLVAVREAHPGSAAPQLQTYEEKFEHAKAMRDLHGHKFEVAVDDINGTLHRALSTKPNSAYIIDKDGKIVFRAQWASETGALAKALGEVADGKSPRRSQSNGTMGAMIRMFRYLPPVLDRAGSGAWRDMWRAMPPVAMSGSALKTMGVGRRKH